MQGKKLFVLLLVLLGVGASAADYMDSFSAYRSQMRRALGVDVTNTTYLSDSTANEFLREGIMTVSPQIGGDRYDTTFRTIFWRSNYTLDTFVLGVKAVVISKNDTAKGLLYVPMSLWYQQEHKSTTGQQDNYLKRPSYWDFYDGKVWLYPPPTIPNDTVRIFAWRKPRSIMDSTINLTALHPMARIAVLKYAIWQAAQARQHPNADKFREEYGIAIVNAKNTIDGGIGVQNPTGSTPTGK